MIGGRWQLLIPVKLALIGTVQNYENQGSCWERISQRAPCSSDFKDVCQNVINRAADKNVESLKQGTGIMYSKLKAVVRQALLLTSLVIEAMIVVRCVLLGKKKRHLVPRSHTAHSTAETPSFLLQKYLWNHVRKCDGPSQIDLSFWLTGRERLEEIRDWQNKFLPGEHAWNPDCINKKTNWRWPLMEILFLSLT